MVNDLGTLNATQALPGVAAARGELQSASLALTAMKDDKSSALSKVQTDITNLSGLVAKAQAIATQAQQLLSTSQATLSSLDTSLNNLGDALEAAGVRVLEYHGQLADFGSEVQALLGPGTQMVFVKVLLVTDGNTWDALNSIIVHQ